MINWTAFAAGIVAAFLLGWLVYGPALGLQRRWAEGTRIDPNPPAKMPLGPMAMQLAALALLAAIIAVTETTQSLGIALLGVGLFVMQAASIGAWAQKSRFAIGVDAGYALACGLVMILAHAIL